jgi:hypothetical protein
VGGRSDPHVATVTGELQRLAAEVVLFDPNEPGARLSYSAGGLCLRAGSVVTEFEPSAFKAVWWRRKPTVRQLETITFADREWQHALEGLPSLLHAARWVNPHHADNALRYKPAQLALATRLGLATPPTLISNDPHAVLEFVAGCGGSAIYKCLTWFIAPPRVLYTSVIDREVVERHAESIACAPGIYQPRIAKHYELRVTIVGDVPFAVRIDSQEYEDTQLDWRRNPLALQHRAVSLPPDVERALLALHHACELAYGAYDLIVTPQGEHIFLEVNSVGQWLWLEQATKLPIARAVALVLLGMPVPSDRLA